MEIKSAWLNSAGRGPTKLISPFKMLQSCGSSSKLDLRMNEPIGVSHWSGLCSKCVANAGVSMRIVRNLGILKMRLCRPTRSDQYSAGPLDEQRTAKAVIARGTSKNVLTHSARVMSKSRFNQALFFQISIPCILAPFRMVKSKCTLIKSNLLGLKTLQQRQVCRKK